MHSLLKFLASASDSDVTRSPSGAAVADLIKRGEEARDGERLRIGGGHRRDQDRCALVTADSAPSIVSGSSREAALLRFQYSTSSAPNVALVSAVNTMSNLARSADLRRFHESLDVDPAVGGNPDAAMRPCDARRLR